MKKYLIIAGIFLLSEQSFAGLFGGVRSNSNTQIRSSDDSITYNAPVIQISPSTINVPPFIAIPLNGIVNATGQLANDVLKLNPFKKIK